jgi:hypothetical protein
VDEGSGKPEASHEIHAGLEVVGFPYNSRGMLKEMWSEILRDVSNVFGDELMAVVYCQGEKVLEDFWQYAPKAARELEDMSRPLRGHPKGASNTETTPPAPATETNASSRNRSLRNGREIVLPMHAQPEPPPKSDLATAAPLTLHVYVGYRQHEADLLMGHALSMFANKNLTFFYFCSDPNNLNLVGHGR